MKVDIARYVLTGFFFCIVASSHSAPMGFKDSAMAMGDFGANWREAWVNYAYTPRDALGVGGIWMRSDNRQKTREFAEINYTHLLKRWNGENSQANAWLLTGIGSVKGNDFEGTRLMAAPGISLDWESRRLYVSGTARLYRASGLKHDYAAARAGFSFYLTEYDEAQPWLILEARRMKDLSDKTEITPMLRMIHKRYFVEAGVNNFRQGRMNFMYIFSVVSQRSSEESHLI